MVSINRPSMTKTTALGLRGKVTLRPNYAATRGFSALRSDSVKISTPVEVTPTECSNCADSERSRVTAVQPSDRIFTCGLPRLIIGSMVKKKPGFSVTPPPGRAILMNFGSVWDKGPKAKAPKNGTTPKRPGPTQI